MKASSQRQRRQANALVILADAKLNQERIEKEAELDRKEKQLQREILADAKARRKIPSPVLAIRRLTQRSVKLLRWLKSSILDRIARDAATPRLRASYATLWTAMLDTVLFWHEVLKWTLYIERIDFLQFSCHGVTAKCPFRTSHLK
jgi:hypothetical protein